MKKLSTVTALPTITALLLCAYVQSGQAAQINATAETGATAATGATAKTGNAGVVPPPAPGALPRTIAPPPVTLSPALLNRPGGLTKALQQLDARKLLKADEGQRFDQLFGKIALTPEEVKELESLVQTGTLRRLEYLGLMNNVQRTQAETARMKKLEAIEIANGPALQKLGISYPPATVASSVIPTMIPPGNAAMWFYAPTTVIPPGDAAMRLYAMLVEQNARPIAQNEQIIALLRQIAEKK